MRATKDLDGDEKQGNLQFKFCLSFISLYISHRIISSTEDLSEEDW